ncbi:PREDICTED: uncharacterized protein LOC104757606 [Camelina sativa]|uniref:Uncharacterized protein LOC104757606 n=1 Tax=Camelina sativa TaxID=90675 RepID=A0ABM0UXE0_CAMSA|nr:PREDICTED: uncharacterized protein LOC104757606 [Camelina sativa]
MHDPIKFDEGIRQVLRFDHELSFSFRHFFFFFSRKWRQGEKASDLCSGSYCRLLCLVPAIESPSRPISSSPRLLVSSCPPILVVSSLSSVPRSQEISSVSPSLRTRRLLCLLCLVGLINKAQLAKLPKNLLAKASLTKATGQALAQLPQVISSLDAHIESGLHSGVHLNTVTQLFENMESTQLRALRQSNISPVTDDK